MSKKLEKWCLAIIFWGSGLILLTPLVVSSTTFYPYVFGKTILFRILTEIILASWLILIIHHPQYRPKWKSSITITSLIFLFVLFFTSITGIDGQKSFWSTQERMTGFLTIGHLWLWFLVLSSTLKSPRDWLKLVWMTLLCSLVVGFYGLGQKLGIRSFLPEADIDRMASTLGNTLFLGAYALLSACLAIFLVFYQSKKLPRLLAIFIFIFNIAIIFLTASRTIIFSLVLVFVGLLIYLLIISPVRRTRLFVISALIILVLILLTGFIFLQTQKNKTWLNKAPVFIQRITSITEASNERTMAWEIAWQGFINRPILGWGWENYNIIFNKYFKPIYLQFGEKLTWFDRSHNQLLDLLSLTGLIGLSSYLLFYGSIFKTLFQKLKKLQPSTSNRNESMAIVVLILMFAAYFIQNLTVFDTPSSLIIFYFSLGLICGLIKNDQAPALNQINNDIKPNKKKTNWSTIVLIPLIVIFLIIIIFKFNLEPLQQSSLGYRAMITAKTDFNLSLQLYKNSLAKNIFTNPEIRLKLAQTIAQQNNNLDRSMYKEGLDFAISEMKKNIQEHPHDVRYFIYLGQLYNLGSMINEEYVDQAEKILTQAMTLSPQRQQIYFELGRSKILKKQYIEAIDIIKQAVALDKRVYESRHNLGMAYIVAGQIREGIAELDASYYATDEHNLLYFSKLFAGLNNYPRAIEFCNLALEKNPNSLNAIGFKIIYLQKSNQPDQAQQLLEELRSKNPQAAAELEQFIKNNPSI